VHSGILFLLFFASLRTAKNIQIVAGHFIFSQTVAQRWKFGPQQVVLQRIGVFFLVLNEEVYRVCLF
jgi:hypothetical protein